MPRTTEESCPSCGQGKKVVSGDHITCTICNYRHIEGKGKKIVLDGAFKKGDKL